MFDWFKKNKSTLPYNDFAEYYIGAGINLSGDFKTDQDIYIDGKFTGSIITSGLVELAKNSSVKANIKSRSVVLEGFFEGSALAQEELRVSSCATVSGNLEATSLVIEKNAVVNSNIKMARNK